MSVPLLFSEPPDLEGQYWRVRTDTAHVVRDNGCRINLDHQARVLAARKVLDLSVAAPIALSTPARVEE